MIVIILFILITIVVYLSKRGYFEGCVHEWKYKETYKTDYYQHKVCTRCGKVKEIEL